MVPGAALKLVISAVNFTEGGPLTVLREAVRAAAVHRPAWDVVVLVHKRGLTRCEGVTEIEFPHAKRSWCKRLRTEWLEFDRLSRDLAPDVWLSLHDITPRVQARRQYVYCHNPAPFSTLPIPGERLDPKFTLFRLFYGGLYRQFIHRNHAVIVQQEWLREQFLSRYGVQRVIVAHPDVQSNASPVPRDPTQLPARFLYPAFPRVFKNFELLGETARMLASDPRWNGEILLTVDGQENAYARSIHERYANVPGLRFIGRQSPEAMASWYEHSHALVFPSLLETWGLPLTEAKAYGLPIVAADLPYARETVGNCNAIEFVAPLEPRQWADRLLSLHLGERSFGHAHRARPPQPFAEGWAALFHQLLVVDEFAS